MAKSTVPHLIRSEWKGKGHTEIKLVDSECKFCLKNFEIAVEEQRIRDFLEEKPKKGKKKKTQETKNEEESKKKKLTCSHSKTVKCYVSNLNILEYVAYEEEYYQDENYTEENEVENTLPPTISQDTWDKWTECWETKKTNFVDLGWVHRYPQFCKEKTKKWYSECISNDELILKDLKYGDTIELKQEKILLEFEPKSGEEYDKLVDELYLEHQYKRHWVHFRLFLRDSEIKVDKDLEDFFMDFGIVDVPPVDSSNLEENQNSSEAIIPLVESNQHVASNVPHEINVASKESDVQNIILDVPFKVDNNSATCEEDKTLNASGIVNGVPKESDEEASRIVNDSSEEPFEVVAENDISELDEQNMDLDVTRISGTSEKSDEQHLVPDLLKNDNYKEPEEIRALNESKGKKVSKEKAVASDASNKINSNPEENNIQDGAMSESDSVNEFLDKQNVDEEISISDSGVAVSTSDEVSLSQNEELIKDKISNSSTSESLMVEPEPDIQGDTDKLSTSMESKPTTSIETVNSKTNGISNEEILPSSSETKSPSLSNKKGNKKLKENSSPAKDTASPAEACQSLLKPVHLGGIASSIPYLMQCEEERKRKETSSSDGQPSLQSSEVSNTLNNSSQDNINNTLNNSSKDNINNTLNSVFHAVTSLWQFGTFFSKSFINLVCFIFRLSPFAPDHPLYMSFSPYWWFGYSFVEESLIEKLMRKSEKEAVGVFWKLFRPTIRHITFYPPLFSKESLHWERVEKFDENRLKEEHLIKIKINTNEETKSFKGVSVLDMTEEEIDYEMELLGEDPEDKYVVKNSQDGSNKVKFSEIFDKFGNFKINPFEERKPLTLTKKLDSIVAHYKVLKFDLIDAKTQSPPDLGEHLIKYWMQRYRYFLRYDEGIRLDDESWYSVTPELLAAHQAERCRCKTVIDAFCGAGGNSIQLAKTCEKVIAIDIDPVKIRLAKHNAKVYGVEDRIEFIIGNFFTLAPGMVADVVFLSPPWGGIQYKDVETYDIFTLGGAMNGKQLYATAKNITRNIVMYLPKNSDILQIIELAGCGGKVDIEYDHISNKRKSLTAYFGNLVNYRSQEDK